MDNLSGQDIKGYQLRERIGTGGFGAVYRAYQSTVGREVAIKIILPGFANHPDFIRRFETEAQIIARLEHLHIVPLYDYWRDFDGAYLVMRWLKGGSLRNALNSAPYDLESTAFLLDQVTSALSAAHQRQIIHRDLKPSNILLDEDGNAYLADFGIAKDLNLKEAITDRDAIVGSPDYLAPEQARNDPITPQTDIYSLGVVLYEMLTGQHPFPNLSSIERLYKHLNDPLPLLENLRPEVSDAVNKVIQTATAKNPAHRFADTMTLASAFRQASALPEKESLPNIIEMLTQREHEILHHIIHGRSNKEIAEELFITLTTVKWYIKQIYRKLNVRSRVQAIVRARELSLIFNGAGISMTEATALVTDSFRPENPYKGLHAFQSVDYRDFFGREDMTKKLVGRMGEQDGWFRFLTIVGPSGSGKSSLIKAGLIPALWRGELAGSEKWFIVELVPGSHPMDELEVALTRIATTPAVNLHEHLERDARGLIRVAQMILPGDGSELVLVIDQFEEIFTLVTDETIRTHFLELLYTAVTDPRSCVRVVIALRADFYDRPLRYANFAELIHNRIETILPLGAKSLERAISGPAERIGVNFEEGLIATIIDEINYQAGALPLLQYALTELFERRQGRLLTRAAYQEIGGVGGALAKRAEKVYTEFPPSGQEAIRQMFLRLVTLGEGVEDTRRRVSRSELLAITADTELIEEVIETYAAYRLLSLDHDPATRTPTVEVAHEAILREWEGLRYWLNESRDEIRLQRLLAYAAAEWREARQDASFLLRGSRLEVLEKWAAETQMALTRHERDFLNASIATRKQEHQAEQDRQVREIRLEQRSRRFLRGLVAVFTVATVIAIGLSLLAFGQQHRAENARATSDANFGIAQTNFTRAESQRLAGLANILLRDERADAELITLLAVRSVNLAYSPEGDLALGSATALNIPRMVLNKQNEMYTVAWSPDGQSVLGSGPGFNQVNLRNSTTGEILMSIPTDGYPIFESAFSSDGTTILLTEATGAGRLFDIRTGNIIHTFYTEICHLNLPTAAITFSPDSKMILTSGLKKLTLWDLQTFHHIQIFEGHTNCISQATFSPDGRTIASADLNGNVLLRDIETGNIVHRISLFSGTKVEGQTRGLAYSPDGQILAIANDLLPGVSLWDVKTGEQLRSFYQHQDGAIKLITALKFSPDGRYIVTASLDTTIRLWDVATGAEVARYRACRGGCFDVDFSPDGRYIITTADPTGAPYLLIWDTLPQFELPILMGHTGNVIQAVFSPDGQTILTGSQDGTARLWETQTGNLLYVLRGHTDDVLQVIFSKDGKQALASSLDQTIIIWDVESGETLHTLTPGAMVSDLAFTPDGRYLVFSKWGTNVVELWDTETWQLSSSLTIGEFSIFNLDISPDGQFMITTSPHRLVRVTEISTGRTAFSVNVGTSRADDAVFAPDGLRLFTNNLQGQTRVWDAGNGTLLQTLSVGNQNDSTHLAVSPDGRYLLSGALDTGVSLWDIAANRELRRFPGQFGVFSPDGQTILISGYGNSAQLFYLDYQSSIDYLCNRLLRDFTEVERQQYSILDDAPTCPEFKS